jgi:alpha-amylase/alpha-mannosidase (GH57 family)
VTAATRPKVQDKRAEDLKKLGLNDQQVAAYMAEHQAEEAEETLAVWPENWDALMLFFRLKTQWLVGFGGATGLNYESVEWVMALLKIEDKAGTFERLQVLEFAALDAWAEKDSHGR